MTEASDQHYKLCFYVPVSHVEQVKTAIFEAGTWAIMIIAAFRRWDRGSSGPCQGASPFSVSMTRWRWWKSTGWRRFAWARACKRSSVRYACRTPMKNLPSICGSWSRCRVRTERRCRASLIRLSGDA